MRFATIYPLTVDRLCRNGYGVPLPLDVEELDFGAKLLRRNRFEVLTVPTRVEVEQRQLADYDAALGLDGPVA